MRITPVCGARSISRLQSLRHRLAIFDSFVEDSLRALADSLAVARRSALAAHSSIKAVTCNAYDALAARAPSSWDGDKKLDTSLTATAAEVAFAIGAVSIGIGQRHGPLPVTD